MDPISGNEKLYLVGFRIDPDVSEPQVYTLYVDDERPVLRGGRPLLFIRPDIAENALKESDCGASAIGPAPQEVYAVFDIADCLFILDSKDEVPNGNVVDCINVLLDFANLLADPMPTQYRVSLEQLADHLTFNLHFADFLEKQNIPRRVLIDALFWCLGSVVCHGRIVAA
jgi:hypothetical protein